jgi:hypothetical protein
MINKVFKLEELSENIQKLWGILKLEREKIPIVKVNESYKLKKDLESLADPATQIIIQELYKVDFETFNYPMDLKIEEIKNHFDDQAKFYFIIKQKLFGGFK